MTLSKFFLIYPGNDVSDLIMKLDNLQGVVVGRVPRVVENTTSTTPFFA